MYGIDGPIFKAYENAKFFHRIGFPHNYKKLKQSIVNDLEFFYKNATKDPKDAMKDECYAIRNISRQSYGYLDNPLKRAINLKNNLAMHIRLFIIENTNKDIRNLKKQYIRSKFTLFWESFKSLNPYNESLEKTVARDILKYLGF